jgi:ubiquinone biosynthesis protein Coq4
MWRALRELQIRSPWTLWRMLRNFAITVWDPTRSDIQDGIQTFVYRGLREARPEQVRALEQASPELAALFREGYDPELSQEELERLPEGSLGREYARFLRGNALTPLKTLLAMGEPDNLLEYLARRAYKLHDLMHVVLGADASVLGEVRIVSYTIGQTRSPGARAPAMALAVLFMNIGLRRPHEMREAIRLAAHWLAVGERSAWHVSWRVEDLLEKPVAEVRAAMLAGALEDVPGSGLGSARLNGLAAPS